MSLLCSFQRSTSSSLFSLFTPDFPDFHFRFMDRFERFSFNFRFLLRTCQTWVIHKKKSVFLIWSLFVSYNWNHLNRNCWFETRKRHKWKEIRFEISKMFSERNIFFSHGIFGVKIVVAVVHISHVNVIVSIYFRHSLSSYLRFDKINYATWHHHVAHLPSYVIYFYTSLAVL